MAQPTADPNLRPLTLAERFLLMRLNAGAPGIIVHVVRYPLARLPSFDDLSTRVTALQERMPMLHAGVTGQYTNAPVWGQGYTFAPFQMVREVELASADPMQLFTAEIDTLSAQLLAPNDNRAWSVVRVTAGEEGYLVLALSQLLVDGAGSAALLHALTGDALPEAEEWGRPTLPDDTVLAPASAPLRERVLSKLPGGIKSLFGAGSPPSPPPSELPETWPGEVPSPIGKPADYLQLKLSPDLIVKLNAAGRSRKVPLRAILMTAYLASIWRVFGSKTLRFASTTAHDERQPALGHSVMHNYATAIPWDVSLSGSDGVWARARECSTRLGRDGIEAGRTAMRLLANIPDPVVDPPVNPRNPGLSPTGWEQHYTARPNSARPFATSLHMNVLDLQLPPGATDAFWGESASAFGAAYSVNIAVHAAGARVMTAWIEGSSGSRAQSEELHRVFQDVLGGLCDGDGSVAEMTEEA